MKQVLVFDSTSSRSDVHCNGLRQLGHSVFCFKNGRVDSADAAASTVPKVFDLVLLHSNDEPAFAHQNIAGPNLRYGGSVLVDPERVPRAVSPGSELTLAELRAFCDYFFANSSKGIADAVSAVWFDNDSLYALRLLCDAYLAEPPGAHVKDYPPQSDGMPQIVFECPDPNDWFEMLGAANPASAQDTAALNAFGKLMGEAEVAAKELAQAIKNGTGMAKAASDFVTKVQQIQQNAA